MADSLDYILGTNSTGLKERLNFICTTRTLNYSLQLRHNFEESR